MSNFIVYIWKKLHDFEFTNFNITFLEESKAEKKFVYTLYVCYKQNPAKTNCIMCAKSCISHLTSQLFVEKYTGYHTILGTEITKKFHQSYSAQKIH